MIVINHLEINRILELDYSQEVDMPLNKYS